MKFARITQQMLDDNEALSSFARRNIEHAFVSVEEKNDRGSAVTYNCLNPDIGIGVSLCSSSDDCTPSLSFSRASYRIPEAVTRPMKTYCQWCHGETVDDSRGNCSACGASRSGNRRR